MTQPEFTSASRAASGREVDIEGDANNGHTQPPAASPWQRQQGHDSSSMAPAPSSKGWWQPRAPPGQQGHGQGTQAGQYGGSWHLDGVMRPEQAHLGEQRSFHGPFQAQANGWHGSFEAQALGAEGAGYAGQPGNLGSVLQGIMTKVHSIAGASPAPLHYAPSPGHMGWAPP